MECLCLHFLWNLLANGERKTQHQDAEPLSSQTDGPPQKGQFEDPLPASCLCKVVVFIMDISLTCVIIISPSFLCLPDLSCTSSPCVAGSLVSHSPSFCFPIPCILLPYFTLSVRFHLCFSSKSIYGYI